MDNRKFAILGSAFKGGVFSCAEYRGIDRAFLPTVPEDEAHGVEVNNAIDRFYDLVIGPGEILLDDLPAALSIVEQYNRFSTGEDQFEVVELIRPESWRQDSSGEFVGWDLVWGQSNSLILQFLCSSRWENESHCTICGEYRKIRDKHMAKLNKFCLFDDKEYAYQCIEDVLKGSDLEPHCVREIPLLEVAPLCIISRG